MLTETIGEVNQSGLNEEYRVKSVKENLRKDLWRRGPSPRTEKRHEESWRVDPETNGRTVEVSNTPPLPLLEFRTNDNIGS